MIGPPPAAAEVLRGGATVGDLERAAIGTLASLLWAGICAGLVFVGRW